MLRLRRSDEPAGARPGAVAVARQQADRAAEAELVLRRHQQRRAGWLEANTHLGPAYRRVVRELAWQGRARGLALDHDQPGYLRDELGPLPESTRGRRTWRQAAAAIEAAAGSGACRRLAPRRHHAKAPAQQRSGRPLAVV
jgi:hypothetical protein